MHTSNMPNTSLEPTAFGCGSVLNCWRFLALSGMQALVAVSLLTCALCSRAAELVIVPNTASPDGAFSIRLTHDRAKETDPPNDDAPSVEIIATASNTVLAAFPFAADLNSDLQPLRTKVRAHWNRDGTAVALSFFE